MATLQRTTAGCVRWLEILVNSGIVNNIVSMYKNENVHGHTEAHHRGWASADTYSNSVIYTILIIRC